MTEFVIFYLGVGVICAFVHIIQKRLYRHFPSDSDFWLSIIVEPLIWPLVFFARNWFYFQRDRSQQPKRKPFIPDKIWLTKRISAREAEDTENVQGVPFGSKNRDWEEIKIQLRPGDEIWRFESPRPLQTGHVWIGYSLIRNGEPIDGLFTGRLLQSRRGRDDS
mgnify:FL=1